ncbi:Holliday junction branch migration protein RuvA [Chitinispirillales bacterium ANBcel5]|uniref:Holliday junction branch migration protein RuvA n=1 Tax=Cellulosispirillum alkaliphilum TaxID=3039283 RepID=UPI002A57C5EF|nr:Holliday junction branch migration protein RuvA [Chitinispirillales bacterium ANBcel5]
MIEYIRGILSEKELMQVAIECSGVGYSVIIPISTFELLPDEGEEVKLFIHYYVREDAVKLYGFSSRSDREIFRHLINISKVGPKVAISILSGVSVERLVSSVNASDPSALEKVPGIGAKTAQRLIVELKDKLKDFSSNIECIPSSSKKSSVISKDSLPLRDEAFAAMVALGYNDKQVGRAMARVEEVITSDAAVDEWIKMALQVI